MVSTPRLTADRAFPRPRSRSRVSALRHTTMATKRMALHDTAQGSPGYRERVDNVLSDGWPTGIHHGRIGAKPAASTNVRILRLIQPLIFGTAFFLRIFRQTKNSHARSAAANGIQPYCALSRSTHSQARHTKFDGCVAASLGSKYPPAPALPLIG